MDVPSYAETLIVTDAAVNIAPTMEDKVHIIQDAAGIVLGARVPIILTSRADSVTTRLASCGIAALVADARRGAAGKLVI